MKKILKENDNIEMVKVKEDDNFVHLVIVDKKDILKIVENKND